MHKWFQMENPRDPNDPDPKNSLVALPGKKPRWGKVVACAAAMWIGQVDKDLLGQKSWKNLRSLDWILLQRGIYWDNHLSLRGFMLISVHRAGGPLLLIPTHDCFLECQCDFWFQSHCNRSQYNFLIQLWLSTQIMSSMVLLKAIGVNPMVHLCTGPKLELCGALVNLGGYDPKMDNSHSTQSML